MPGVSVVIRALNESELIGWCLGTLRALADSDDDLQIVVVDSGSTDRTAEISRSFGATVIEFPLEEFDYSKSLNLGIEHAKGSLVVILSAHAIPREPEWLEWMTRPFEDPSVGGVCCRQVPWPGSEWTETRRIARRFDDVPRVFDFRNRGGLLFSNAASCIRKDVWEHERFVLPAAEDMDWAVRVIDAGWRIAYEPRASVIHSHSDSIRGRAKRLIDISRAADVASGRIRTPARTGREAIGFFAREVREIWSLDDGLA